MPTVLQKKNDAAGENQETVAGKAVATPARARSVSLDTPNIEALGDKDRKEVLTLAGKEIASTIGSRVLRAMLAESGMSMREVARRSGFDVSLLSNIAKGKRTSGPELWTLVALAEAMGMDLDLHFSRR